MHHLFLVGCSKDPVALVRRKSVAPQRQKQHDDKGEQGEQGEHEAGSLLHKFLLLPYPSMNS